MESKASACTFPGHPRCLGGKMSRAITAALHGENGNHIGAPGAEGLRGVKAVKGWAQNLLD